MFLGVIMLSGCTAQGPKFDNVRHPQTSDMAQVFVYREDTAQGSAYSLDVQLDTSPVISVDRNGYIPYLVKPGIHKVKVKMPFLSFIPNEEMMFFAKQGEKYVIWIHTNFGRGESLRVYSYDEMLPKLSNALQVSDTITLNERISPIAGKAMVYLGNSLLSLYVNSPNKADFTTFSLSTGNRLAVIDAGVYDLKARGSYEGHIQLDARDGCAYLLSVVTEKDKFRWFVEPNQSLRYDEICRTKPDSRTKSDSHLKTKT